MDLDLAVVRYLRHHRAEGSSPKTLQWHSYSLERYRRFCRDEALPDELDADTVRLWIAAMRDAGLSQAYVNSNVRSVKAFSRWLYAEEYVPKDPLARLKPPKVEDKAQETLDPEDVDRLLKACDQARQGWVARRDKAIIVLLFSTGVLAGWLIRAICGG